jgi:hypothetical protein
MHIGLNHIKINFSEIFFVCLLFGYLSFFVNATYSASYNFFSLCLVYSVFLDQCLCCVFLLFSDSKRRSSIVCFVSLFYLYYIH